MADDPVRAQADEALAVLREQLGSARLLGTYLYGSAVEGGLRPDSDLDLFVLVDRPLTSDEKARVVAGLLPISGRTTRPAGWRPLELTVVAVEQVRRWHYPPRMELQYGEWLRPEFLAGRIEPQPADNPDLGILLSLVRSAGVPLIGPPAADLIGEVPQADLRRAMLDAIPSLLADLEEDTRNVLLTLARMWITLATGQVQPKDEAADWALGRLPEAHRPVLERARDLYRTGGYGDWPETDDVNTLVASMLEGIRQAAEAPPG